MLLADGEGPAVRHQAQRADDPWSGQPGAHHVDDGDVFARTLVLSRQSVDRQDTVHEDPGRRDGGAYPHHRLGPARHRLRKLP